MVTLGRVGRAVGCRGVTRLREERSDTSGREKRLSRGWNINGSLKLRGRSRKGEEAEALGLRGRGKHREFSKDDLRTDQRGKI